MAINFSIDALSNLAEQWKHCVGGNTSSQAYWYSYGEDEWEWSDQGVILKRASTEWGVLSWRTWDQVDRKQLKNFVIEVSVSGRAEAAGLSFGAYKDFLIEINSENSSKHLQLEVDTEANCWTFRVDGQLKERCWWDSAVNGVESIIAGNFSLKARNAGEVLFQNLAFHSFESSCKLSMIITCHRFLQRLRVTLRNWCHQEISSGAYEILVVNPESPDGTHEYLAAVSRCYPNIRVREIRVSADKYLNKGMMINQALRASRGEWIWLTDADCLFSTTSLAHVLDKISGNSNILYFGQRRFLSEAQTDALLVGRIDGLKDFEKLAQVASPRTPENYPWGYTQIIHRRALERIHYREDFNHYAHSDGAFIEECKRSGITSRQIDGLFCLHLDHPFSWYGTEIFL